MTNYKETNSESLEIIRAFDPHRKTWFPFHKLSVGTIRGKQQTLEKT